MENVYTGKGIVSLRCRQWDREVRVEWEIENWDPAQSGTGKWATGQSVSCPECLAYAKQVTLAGKNKIEVCAWMAGVGQALTATDR